VHIIKYLAAQNSIKPWISTCDVFRFDRCFYLLLLTDLKDLLRSLILIMIPIWFF